MKIKRFGESDASKKQWFENEAGERVFCNEATIAVLWAKWVAAEEAKRYMEGEFLIFDFSEPIEY